ncbi:hypothetical protein [Archangium sp.]|jgi:hypothetical protein|uniref:hypothetical protein n=1 Tax=Archangium sp. TaxID=1872627 RepID=UPI002EDB2B35
MADAARSIIVICEAAADQRTACGIVDRILSQSVDWMQPEVLDALREWRGLTKSEPFLAWKNLHARADAANIHINGLFGGEPGAPDAFIARRALALLTTQGERNIDAVLLLRDSDMDTRRYKGLEQARAQTSGLGPIIIGVAHPKREAWVLAGFHAATDDERSRLEALRRALGFDPRLHAEDLTAAKHGAKRDAKRVLSELTQGDHQREVVCWTEAPLEQLEARGKGTGLADFIQEVRERLVPLWTGRPATQQD